MKRHSKTREEKAAEVAEAETICWKQFHPKLASLHDLSGARTLVFEAPFRDAPGRRYYTNLEFFLGSFMPPGGADATELSLYLKLIQQPAILEELLPEVREKAEKELVKAIARRSEDL